ncbi:MAG: TM2 domain-containing protein [Flavobacteriales bacterium]
MKGAALAGAIFLSAALPARAAGPFTPLLDTLDEGVLSGSRARAESSAGAEPQRAVAIGLAVLLGPFGAHRLYLGTTPKVAIVYGLTLGGFGVLALIDLVHLIVVRDLSPYCGSDRVLMWAGGPTPP